MDADEEKCWHPRQELFYRKLVDGGMLYDAENDHVRHFNSTAAWVWEACQSGASTAGMISGLCERFAVEPQQASEDVNRLLLKFSQGDLFQP